MSGSEGSEMTDCELDAWPEKIKIGSRIFERAQRLYYLEHMSIWFGVYARTEAEGVLEVHLTFLRAVAHAWGVEQR